MCKFLEIHGSGVENQSLRGILSTTERNSTGIPADFTEFQEFPSSGAPGMWSPPCPGLRDSGISRNFIKSPRISGNPVEYHWIPPNTKEFHGIPWNSPHLRVYLAELTPDSGIPKNFAKSTHIPNISRNSQKSAGIYAKTGASDPGR